MRFMFLMHCTYEGQPTPELLAAMHDMAKTEVAAGRMIADGGLAPLATGKRVRIKGRKLVVMDGPFTETKEVIGGFAVFELPDMDAAVDCARRFMDLHIQHAPDWQGVCEVRAMAGSMVELVRAEGQAA